MHICTAHQCMHAIHKDDYTSIYRYNSTFQNSLSWINVNPFSSLVSTTLQHRTLITEYVSKNTLLPTALSSVTLSFPFLPSVHSICLCTGFKVMKYITYTTYTEVEKHPRRGNVRKVAGSVNAIAMNWVISEDKGSKKIEATDSQQSGAGKALYIPPSGSRRERWERKIKRNKTAERTGSIYISLTHLKTPAPTQNRISTHFASLFHK
jgi:hypothetical protein